MWVEMWWFMRCRGLFEPYSHSSVSRHHHVTPARFGTGSHVAVKCVVGGLQAGPWTSESVVLSALPACFPVRLVQAECLTCEEQLLGGSLQKGRMSEMTQDCDLTKSS